MERELTADLAKSLEAVASLRRDQNRLVQQRKRKRWDGFTDIQRRSALVLYVMADFAMKPVLFYLLQIMGVVLSSATDADTAYLQALVETWFLSCTDVQVEQLTQASFPGDAYIFRRARSILRSITLRDWVFSMNITKGLAPSCRDVALKWDNLAASEVLHGDDPGDLDRSDLTMRKNRAFFSTWRQKLSIKVGKIQTRAFMSRTEIADKVKSCGFQLELKFAASRFQIDRSFPINIASLL